MTSKHPQHTQNQTSEQSVSICISATVIGETVDFAKTKPGAFETRCIVSDANFALLGKDLLPLCNAKSEEKEEGEKTMLESLQAEFDQSSLPALGKCRELFLNGAEYQQVLKAFQKGMGDDDYDDDIVESAAKIPRQSSPSWWRAVRPSFRKIYQQNSITQRHQFRDSELSNSRHMCNVMETILEYLHGGANSEENVRYGLLQTSRLPLHFALCDCNPDVSLRNLIAFFEMELEKEGTNKFFSQTSARSICMLIKEFKEKAAFKDTLDDAFSLLLQSLHLGIENTHILNAFFDYLASAPTTGVQSKPVTQPSSEALSDSQNAGAAPRLQTRLLQYSASNHTVPTTCIIHCAEFISVFDVYYLPGAVTAGIADFLRLPSAEAVAKTVRFVTKQRATLCCLYHMLVKRFNDIKLANASAKAKANAAKTAGAAADSTADKKLESPKPEQFKFDTTFTLELVSFVAKRRESQAGAQLDGAVMVNCMSVATSAIDLLHQLAFGQINRLEEYDEKAMLQLIAQIPLLFGIPFGKNVTNALVPNVVGGEDCSHLIAFMPLIVTRSLDDFGDSSDKLQRYFAEQEKTGGVKLQLPFPFYSMTGSGTQVMKQRSGSDDSDDEMFESPEEEERVSKQKRHETWCAIGKLLESVLKRNKSISSLLQGEIPTDGVKDIFRHTFINTTGRHLTVRLRDKVIKFKVENDSLTGGLEETLEQKESTKGCTVAQEMKKYKDLLPLEGDGIARLYVGPDCRFDEPSPELSDKGMQYSLIMQYHGRPASAFTFGRATCPYKTAKEFQLFFVAFVPKIFHLNNKLIELDKIVSKAGEGDAYSDEDSVIHADTKPDNILIDEQGRVTIIDWESARTPKYMAPEVFGKMKEACTRPQKIAQSFYSAGKSCMSMITDIDLDFSKCKNCSQAEELLDSAGLLDEMKEKVSVQALLEKGQPRLNEFDDVFIQAVKETFEYCFFLSGKSSQRKVNLAPLAAWRSSQMDSTE